MHKFLYSVKQMWEKVKPQATEYVISKDTNGLWSVKMFKGSLRCQIGPRFKGRGDVMRFYEDITTTGEAKYE
jgi:hypothetical protein|tara:strand:+ start:225 stop:440 length:216 start_codon:yes stop_codon:yes gene_type:complete